ncbi:MAG: MFS transporter [Kiloniellales bacterium]|nr:MFS transporter [Kiloniellales bacterium]
MHVRYPIWLRRVDRPGARVFAVLFALESLSRALLVTVVSLQALALLKDARDVSLAFALVGVTGLLASFTIPIVVRLLARRFTYTLGALLLVAAAGALATLTLPGQIAGMLFRVYGASCLAVTTSLYIMQYINKKDLTRSEPLRLQFSALAWTLGPWLGVALYEALGPNWTYGASAGAALTLLAVFWWIRLQERPVIGPATKPPPNPLRNLRRFFAQPRLRLAWIMVVGRSSWWVFFFVYGPVYMLQAGEGKQTAALVVSAGNAVLFLSPVFGRLAARNGLRPVMTAAFLCVGGCTLLTVAVFDQPYAVAGLFLAGALGCAALDALGNIPFIRAVRPHERPQMTTVFRTYLDAAELITPTLCALVLTLADLRTMFFVFGLFVLSFALWPRFLPRRL